MPSVHDLAERFEEYLRQTDMSLNTKPVYVSAVRTFGAWLAARPHYGDALIDVEVRDQALAEYLVEFRATHAPGTYDVAQAALRMMFRWLEMPPAVFPRPVAPPRGEPVVNKYAMGTEMVWRDGEPFKARAICVDGRLRTTDRLVEATRLPGYIGSLSYYKGEERHKISGSVFIESASGEPFESPDDPLVVKFEAHEYSGKAELLGFGRWRKDHT